MGREFPLKLHGKCSFLSIINWSKWLHLWSPFPSHLPFCLSAGLVLLAVSSASSPAVSSQAAPPPPPPPQLISLRTSFPASFESLSTQWKRPGSVFVSCVGGRGRPWENSSKVQKNFTSSSLNKRALLHLFAQIFPLPMEKNASSFTSTGFTFLGLGVPGSPFLHTCFIPAPSEVPCRIWAWRGSRSVLGGLCSEWCSDTIAAGTLCCSCRLPSLRLRSTLLQKELYTNEKKHTMSLRPACLSASSAYNFTIDREEIPTFCV